MAVDKRFAAHVEELLAGLGPVRIKAMFGAAGVYVGELMVAIIDDDVLYFRGDAETESQFRDAGSTPFIYRERDGREIPMNYFRAPEEALEGPDEAEPWARLSIDAALRKQAAKSKKRKA